MTNISLEPVGILDGIPTKPCVKSGFCCTRAPCDFGTWDAQAHQCVHLMPPNEIGQRDCGRYAHIIEHAPDPSIYPGFGAGCCMPLFNEAREAVIKNIKQLAKLKEK